MANSGAHTNQSQFFITFAPLPALNYRFVAFGKVILGENALQQVQKCPTLNERPTPALRVLRCGRYPIESSSDES